MGGVIDRLYPGTKFIVALVLGVLAFLVPSYWFALAVFLLCVLAAFLTGHGVPFLKLIRNSLLILLIFMFTIRLLFSGGETVYWSWGNLVVSAESLDLALTMALGVLALGSTLLLFFLLTPVKDITAALANAGMSPSASYVILAAIQMIPEMRKQSSTIMDAQKTRGVETEGRLLTRMKAFLPTLGPLVLSSIADTEERVITLESRAFTAPGVKTRLYALVKRPADRAVEISFLVLFVLVVAGRIALWLL